MKVLLFECLLFTSQCANEIDIKNGISVKHSMQISQPLKKSVLYGVLGQDMESTKVVSLNYRIN